MATFVQREGRWRAQVRLRGVSESRSFDTKAQARAWAAERETELRAGVGGSSARKTLRDALQEFSANVATGRRGGRWEVIRCDKLARTMACVDVPLRDLTPELLAKERDRWLRTAKPGTVLRDLSLLGSVLEHARREKRWLSSNPLRDVRRPPPPAARTQVISDDVRERILLALSYDENGPVEILKQETAVAFLLALETAMRAGEIVSLKRSLVRGRVALLPMTKNGSAREVPLSPRALELLSKLPGDGDAYFRVTAATRDALFRKAAIQAGATGIRFHDSRATALTRLSKILDPMTLARLSGHRDLKTLMNVYYRESADDIASRLA